MAPHQDTSLGGERKRFPSTKWSLILQARKKVSPESREALEELCSLYWKPVYAHLRASRAITNDEAKDFVQEFFAELLEGEMLQRFQPDRGSFRAYLKGALHLFVLAQHQRASAAKRGGGKKPLSLDQHDPKTFDLSPADPRKSPEDVFDKQWAEEVLKFALDDLKDELTRSGKEDHFRIFERYEFKQDRVQPATYADVAKELDVPEKGMGKLLYTCRKRLREITVDRIRDYVSDETELGAELTKILELLRS